ncbi:hypothetical protein GN956_G18674 [Arapaima gigas]
MPPLPLGGKYAASWVPFTSAFFITRRTTSQSEACFNQRAGLGGVYVKAVGHRRDPVKLRQSQLHLSHLLSAHLDATFVLMR